MSSLTDHGAIADQVIAVLQPLSESIGTNNVAKPHIRRLIYIAPMLVSIDGTAHKRANNVILADFHKVIE